MEPSFGFASVNHKRTDGRRQKTHAVPIHFNHNNIPRVRVKVVGGHPCLLERALVDDVVEPIHLRLPTEFIQQAHFLHLFSALVYLDPPGQ